MKYGEKVKDVPETARSGGTPRLKPRMAVCAILVAAFSAAVPSSAHGADASLPAVVQPLLAGHPGASGAYVLEKGEESLLARAWLADHAAKTIDIQYFIWSTDNVGILASEALLRAAERGVTVRVLVDDLLVDAPPEAMLVLALHPAVDIRIYNPRLTVGTSKVKRVFNLLRGFRETNLRMHDKTALFDGLVGITGGRNMADEYFDFDHRYNFRDRDILAMGPVVAEMEASFARFWESPLAVPVERLLPEELRKLTPERIRTVHRWLRTYAADRANFAPEVREAIRDIPARFDTLVRDMVWDDVRFVSDLPGKNDGRRGLGGGGRTTATLAGVLGAARRRVTIQSPYLVMPEGALDLMRGLVGRGVDVRIVTNSLASTDNLQAFSGYSHQRAAILGSGVEVFEFKPHPAIERELVERYPRLARESPVFAIHAKTMVVDGQTLFVGTFNLDPRSANLNTEVGVLVRNPKLAAEVEGRIERDMRPENSWNAAERPDRHAPLLKRLKVGFWKLLPLQPIL